MTAVVNQAGRRHAESERLRFGIGSSPAPTRPTTKECNSRASKHFGSRKRRCYNRLTESIFVYRVYFPREDHLRDVRTWERYSSGEHFK